MTRRGLLPSQPLSQSLGFSWKRYAQVSQEQIPKVQCFQMKNSKMRLTVCQLRLVTDYMPKLFKRKSRSSKVLKWRSWGRGQRFLDVEILPAGFVVEGQTGIARIRSNESKHQEDIFIDGGKLNGTECCGYSQSRLSRIHHVRNSWVFCWRRMATNEWSFGQCVRSWLNQQRRFLVISLLSAKQ